MVRKPPENSFGNEREPTKPDPVVELQNIMRSAAATALKPQEQKKIESEIQGFTHRIKIAACKTPDDFRSLFNLLGLDEDKWGNPKGMRQAGYSGFEQAISKHFGGFGKFLDFMGLNELVLDESILRRSHPKQVEACKTPNDFLILFGLLHLTEDVWSNSKKLGDIYSGLQQFITKRFNGWDRFRDFMGLNAVVLDESVLRHPYTKQVQACKTPDDFRTLFNLLGIKEDVWRKNLGEAGFPGLRNAISLRFNGWDKFRDFMGPAVLVLDKSILRFPYTKQVNACKTPDDFRALFLLHELKEDVWENTGKLSEAGLESMKTAISKRFNGWDKFRDFMGLNAVVLDESVLHHPYTKQVEACKTPDDFRTLFLLHELSEDVWKNTGELYRNGYPGLSQVITNRFNGWQNFLDWMDGLDEESQDLNIEKLGLSEAIDLLGHQPARLKLYIKISHPELSEEDIDRIVSSSFRRLTTKKTYDYSEFDETLPPCEIDDSDIPTETAEPMIKVSGRAEGADSVMVYGYRTKRVRTNEAGDFHVRIPLQAGSVNEIEFMPVNHEERTIGQVVSFAVEQTSEPDDIQSLIDLLDEMGKEVLQNIRKDPGRFEYIVHQTEQVLIKKFSKNFEEGRDYIDGLLENAKSSVVKKVLKKILDNFRRIDRSTYPNVRKDSPLYFFQKYCVAEIQHRIERGDRGVILANAPGLGKTRTALVAVNGDPATIIAPNSVVSAWGEEAEKCLIDSDVLTLQNISHKKRMQILEDTEATHVVTNIEFLRGKLGDSRYDLLADEDTIIVHDEAHALSNLGSEQSKGARRLEGKFQLHLTATPFRNPKMMRRMFRNIYPDDSRFSSDAAFTKAFPAHDHEALRKLSIMKNQHVIRFRKEDVLEEMDVNEPIEDQLHRLPKKEYVPAKKHGEYTLSVEQSEAIYELFKDWSKWTKKYDKYVPKDEISKLDHLRGNQFTFGKLHALRQTANNPNYIGADGVEDRKAKEMMKSVAACLKEGRKVVIFCQYNAQAMKYAELLKKYSPSLYTGITSKEGTKKNASGEEMHFRKHEEAGWEMDSRGFPIEDPSGMPMLAMDYERITYQNAPDRKVMIATYSAGAVGVTFTAGKAVILDDLPRDITEEIQAEDRTHRIDHEHQTHHSVKYIRMVSRYPQVFLEKMKKVWVKQKKDGTYAETKNEAYAKKHDYESAYDLFFEQGTYDQVKMENLLAQRNMFQLLNDGIIDESEAYKEERSFAIAL